MFNQLILAKAEVSSYAKAGKNTNYQPEITFRAVEIFGFQ